MADRLDELLVRMRQLQEELLEELQRQQKRFAYRIHRRRVYFTRRGMAEQRLHLLSLGRYLANARLLHILTAPVIWLCIIPAVLLDAAVSLYQAVCFPFYGIPKVRRGEYLIYDHQFLKYLNLMEKLNCLYCSYFNGMLGYVQEIAARTEQYWCPIKHAKRVKSIHSRYKLFFDYGDAARYRKDLPDVRGDFDDIDLGH